MLAYPKLTLTLALLAVCTVGQGQSALEDSVLWRWVELTDAVVTGERDRTSAKEALRMIRTVDEKAIAASGASQLNQLLNSQLNFRISQDPILGSGAALNGLGGEGLTVLVDGVPVRGRLNGQVDLSQLSLSNVERVEIVNGPMAVEYGTNALAGTINLITKSNHREGLQLTATGQYETIGQHEFNLSATHANGEGRNLQASINQYYFDGWSPTDALLDGFAPFLADTGRVALWNPKLQRTARMGGKWKRGDWIVAPAFDVMHETIENRGAPRMPYLEYAFDDVYSTQRISPSIQFRHYGQAGTDWNILASYQAYTRQRASLRTDLTTLDSELRSPSEQDTTAVNTWQTRGTRYFGGNGPWTGSAGWDIVHEDLAGARIADGVQSRFHVDAFGTLAWKGAQQSHQLGIRQGFNSDFDVPLLPSWNGRWGIERTVLRAAYARGFRAPNLKEQHFQFVDTNHELFGNLDLRPESSHFAQVAAEREGRTTVQARVFINHVFDRIGLVDQNDGTFQYENFSAFEAQGIQLNAQQSGETWNLEAGVSLISNRTQAALDEAFQPRILTPEAQVQARWQWHPQWAIAAFIKYNGAQGRFIAGVDGELEQVEAPAYTLIDVNAVDWVSKNRYYRIQLHFKNLADVTSLNLGTPDGQHASGTALIAWGRSVQVRFTYSLNPQKP